MSDVWLTIPTANAEQCGKCFRAWSDRGYKTAVLANGPAFEQPIDNCDFRLDVKEYPGWGNSINILAREVIKEFGATWIVGAGDDMLCDPNLSPDEIAAQLTEHFHGTFGICQPCGDSWPGNVFDICGSPWIGAEFMCRWNGGQGAFWPEYVHHYADNELNFLGLKYGLLWQRSDLTHQHNHWARHGGEPPEYMFHAYAANARDGRLFQRRQLANFPGHDPID